MVQIKMEQPHIPKQHSCALLPAELTELGRGSLTHDFHYTSISFTSSNLWIGTSSDKSNDQTIHKRQKNHSRQGQERCFPGYIIFHYRFRTSVFLIGSTLRSKKSRCLLWNLVSKPATGILKYALSAGNTTTSVWGLYQNAGLVMLQGSEKWK